MDQRVLPTAQQHIPGVRERKRRHRLRRRVLCFRIRGPGLRRVLKVPASRDKATPCGHHVSAKALRVLMDTAEIRWPAIAALCSFLTASHVIVQ